MSGRIFLLIACLLLLPYLGFQSTHGISNEIHPGQSVTASKTIVSANGMFELCFFSPGNSTKYYVGICYNKVSDDHNVVWVANREYPFPNESPVLTFNPEGTLELSDQHMTYSVANTSASNDSYAMLLDTGNLILTNRVLEVLWQSFDVPTDTILPGMIAARSLNLLELTSWKSTEDPARGLYSMVIYCAQLEDGYRIDYLNGSSSMLLKSFAWPSNHTSDISRMVLDVSGQLKLQSWSEDRQRWYSLNSSRCGVHAFCGAFSVCNETVDESCGCLTGFKPRTRTPMDASGSGNKSSGCERETDLQCRVSNNDHQKNWFSRMSHVEWPDNGHLQVNISEDSECELTCLENCHCVAYAYDCGRSNKRLCNCTVWFGDLYNLKQVSSNDGSGKDFNLKLATPNLSNTESNSSTGRHDDDKNDPKRTGNSFWTIVVLSACLATLVLALVYYYVRRELSRKGRENLLLLDLGMNLKTNHSDLSKVMTRGHGDSRKRDVKMPLFSFSSVAAATDNFSAGYKLGEGGFGPVYKGVLAKGGEVAVKRLSRRSGQGWEELKNEAMLIAELQHKNLVKLLGCCIERDEKILVYEYMPNKSLDFFLFDPEKRRILDWGTRVRIIEGVAQGLLYLHQYSRLKIVHRDLKAGNILLDMDMNPKISDFGMARIFGGNESEANTNRIVGTYGYMSPEYALDGLFSIKSDVFSFGVLLLEIVSGRKNTGFYLTNSFHLIGYAWDLWTSNRGRDLVDSLLDDINIPSKHMVLRLVNIGLLCVQESAVDRPTMSDVVAMLGNESAVLACPKQPAFLNARSMVVRAKPVNSMIETCSVNNATNSVAEGR
ncbi:G-type lectin S-receptor-like serine/threonine-protein kinase At1g11300 [Juglans microcarpa x Juglans regia]|uniref:G-type lectin S-receptor-like serine/threonine-protein kinase At1g11300 n=1 Tax=Juglans microcarpa x Juglans regia TaxID=2249226 RepID=UPI001B7DE37C|nr:G-type lectin S-receptor-like serine/threonine-protein kinase At1g11300 [Juglans microcarpa x Juglans regia]